LAFALEIRFEGIRETNLTLTHGVKREEPDLTYMKSGSKLPLPGSNQDSPDPEESVTFLEVAPGDNPEATTPSFG
jgi:hypothetical protein